MKQLAGEYKLYMQFNYARNHCSVIIAACVNQSINQCLFSIQTNNNIIHTFVNMNTERAGK